MGEHRHGALPFIETCTRFPIIHASLCITTKPQTAAVLFSSPQDKRRITAEEKKGRIKTMQITFQSLPASFTEFAALPQQDLTKPENTCALFLCALNLFVQDREEGVRAINLLKGPVQLSNMDIQFLRDRFLDQTYLPRVYFEGATPQNNYTPFQPYRVDILPDPRPQDMPEGYLRYYVKSAGADNPRAMKVRRKGDQWYIWEYFGVVMGVRVPAALDPWA